MVAVAGLLQQAADDALRVVGLENTVGDGEVFRELLAAKFRVGAARRFPVLYLQVVFDLAV